VCVCARVCVCVQACQWACQSTNSTLPIHLMRNIPFGLQGVFLNPELFLSGLERQDSWEHPARIRKAKIIIIRITFRSEQSKKHRIQIDLRRLLNRLASLINCYDEKDEVRMSYTRGRFVLDVWFAALTVVARPWLLAPGLYFRFVVWGVVRSLKIMNVTSSFVMHHHLQWVTLPLTSRPSALIL
jgi:hypothetical protein